MIAHAPVDLAGQIHCSFHERLNDEVIHTILPLLWNAGKSLIIHHGPLHAAWYLIQYAARYLILLDLLHTIMASPSHRSELRSCR